jgi:hypothetical protein
MFHHANYYPILVSSLQVDRPVPFDCYARLNKFKLIQWINKGETFTLEKAQKVSSGSMKDIYVLTTQKEAYFDFLDGFLGSPEGKQTLDALKAADPATLVGIPTPEEYKLRSWMDRPIPSSPASPQEEAVAAESQVESPITVQEPQSTSFVTGSDSSGENVKKIIENSTLKIVDELHKVTGSSAEENFETKLTNATLVLKEEIIRVRGYVDKEAQAKRLVTSGEKLSHRLEQALTSLKAANGASPALLALVKSLREQSKPHFEELEQILVSSRPVVASGANSDELQRLKEELRHKERLLLAAQKENAELNQRNEDLRQKGQVILKKLEGALEELDQLKRKERLVETKNEGAQNAVKNLQTQIDKLTRTNEELRQEKLTYIKQANEAQEQRRALNAKAEHLARQIQARDQTIEELKQKLQQLMPKSQAS